jgi:hypothetical protein
MVPNGIAELTALEKVTQELHTFDTMKNTKMN